MTTAPTGVLARHMIRLAIAGSVAVFFGLLISAASALGTREDIWSVSDGLTGLRVGYILLALGIMPAFLGTIVTARNGRSDLALMALIATVAASAALLYGATQIRTAQNAPQLIDISTDTENPPAFSAIKGLRTNDDNPLDYPKTAMFNGNQVNAAALQREAYPDITAVTADVGRNEMFAAALKAVITLGWTVHTSDPEAKRIEASVRTFWFGFTDDIVVRIQPEPEWGMRLDIRAASRQGVSDMGRNAAHIAAFRDVLIEYLYSGGGAGYEPIDDNP